ncbi:hypothetical protein J2S14_000052 [Lederbergia wuyishanensis]|uniref:Uncharacterized protein n=1 Tax=Lederbergia wuyishanensis TaxID=1347903 RepID=A0ABU0CYP3_9BACI|nr:hypothetical protein [Lederbergia wuyishanensis]
MLTSYELTYKLLYENTLLKSDLQSYIQYIIVKNKKALTKERFKNIILTH